MLLHRASMHSRQVSYSGDLASFHDCHKNDFNPRTKPVYCSLRTCIECQDFCFFVTNSGMPGHDSPEEFVVVFGRVPHHTLR